MRKEAGTSTIATGALVGALLTAALLAIFFLAARLIGTPFVPFDVFDWVARTLPGGLITFGIDLMVSLIVGLNLGETSSTAKLAEQALAIAGLFVTGILAGAVLFAILRRVERRYAYWPGLLTGLIVGLPVLLISARINQTATADPTVGALWILLAFGLWGLALQAVYHRLSVPDAPEATTAAIQQLDRRQFLITLGGATATITVVGAGLGALLSPRTPGSAALLPESTAEPLPDPWSATHALPNANDSVLPAPGTRPELTPLADHYRIDINLAPPVVREDEWKLVIDGLVDNPLELTLNDLRTKYEPVNQFVTLACISNQVGGDLTGTQRWTGVPLKRILAEAKPKGSYLQITAADGFDEWLSVEMAENDERIMLTYAWDDRPLDVKHGFPLRIYIPDRYGMKQPKWITRIEARDSEEEGYWVRRGWDPVARMHATSVIDTIAKQDVITEGNIKKIPVGGIAHAGARGISKVEVQVDGGDWVEAQIRQPLSETTWVIWRYDWPFAAGDHTLAVRCYEADGTPQLEVVADSHPSGATGIFTHGVRVDA